MMPRINVTQEMIDRASKRGARLDPIAEAIKAAIPGACSIAVAIDAIRWTADGIRHSYLPPPAAARAMLAFDQGERVEPLSFMLDRRE